jgi:hypothetical protein
MSILTVNYGYPYEIIVVGKFASGATAISPISNMTKAVVFNDELDGMIPLNLLPDFTVNAYRLGKWLGLGKLFIFCACGTGWEPHSAQREKLVG